MAHLEQLHQRRSVRPGLPVQIFYDVNPARREMRKQRFKRQTLMCWCVRTIVDNDVKLQNAKLLERAFKRVRLSLICDGYSSALGQANV